jgi:hypothetical protein
VFEEDFFSNFAVGDAPVSRVELFDESFQVVEFIE